MHTIIAGRLIFNFNSDMSGSVEIHDPAGETVDFINGKSLHDFAIKYVQKYVLETALDAPPGGEE